ncbi:MAG: AbrB/MazE/SpoVT family DNA-binding domain-containing protein [Nitrospinae bacterium]|nr:AbrB/MazE/SpoVT family DNA-binding domain-containing protein [Nitrospinota bacterium]
MDSTIALWGNSLGLRIPKAFAREVGLNDGTRVQIILDKGRLIIKPAKKYSLKALADRISKDNVYGEVDFGKPEGREVW